MTATTKQMPQVGYFKDMKIGQRVQYQRRGNIYTGVIEAIDCGSIADTYYWVRNDASQIRNAVLPQQFIVR